MTRLVVAGALAAASLASSARADEPPPPPPQSSEDALRAEVARQGAALDALAAALADERKAREREAQEREARENPAIRVSGYVQADWVVHNQESQDEINGSTGQPLNEDRFTLRRGHLRVDAARGLVAGAIEIDANTTNGPQVRPIDAEVSIHWPRRPEAELPSLSASVGLLHIPFGYEVQELDYVRPFLERATALDALFPGQFDLGARLDATYRFLSWTLGVMNGSPIGDKVFPDLDPVAAKEIVGRLGVDFALAPGIRFQAGISGDTGTGFHPGTPATKNTLVWQDQNGDGLVEPNEIVAIGGSPATPSALFHRFAIGSDARLSVRLGALGDLAVRLEAVAAENLDRGLEIADPVSAGRDLREVGWSAGVTQELTRWAMIGARYDLYDPDADATQQRAANLVPVRRVYSTFAVMAMARYESARLLLEYDVNRNPLGVGVDGAPTTLADNALTLRGQVVF